MARLRALLKGHVTRGEVEFMALDYEWQLYTNEKQADKASAYKVWLDGEGEDQSVIIFTDDDLVDLRYISVEGTSAQAVIDHIRASVDVYTREELEVGITQATQHEGWIQALTKLGASLSPTFEQWAFDLVRRGLEHPDPRVRLAAVAAIGFPAWPEFMQPLNQVQETDSDVRVLRRAARMMALLQQASGSGSAPLE